MNNIQSFENITDCIVVKSNDLIQKSRFALSTQQQKILLYLISRIKPSDEQFKLYEFSIAEFCQACNICYSGSNYQELKNSIKELSDKSMWIELQDGTETLVRWIEKPYINKKSGIIKIKFDNDMMPFLLHLKKNFTQYELIYALNFRSKYSIRLYEAISSIHFHKLEEYRKAYDIEQLRKLLGINDNTHRQYREFKRKALEPAINEINKYSDQNIKYDEIKKGRKTIGIELIINSKELSDRAKVRCDVERQLGIEPDIQWRICAGEKI